MGVLFLFVPLTGILQYEQVHIWNVTSGERFTTYALEGHRGSGVV